MKRTLFALSIFLVPATAAALSFVPFESEHSFPNGSRANVIARMAGYYDPADPVSVEVECTAPDGASAHLFMPTDDAKKFAKGVWDAAWAAETP
jgi:hypothetical protein